jgi:LysR family transcriptional regulator, glycine cleavage system transcriptional activator
MSLATLGNLPLEWIRAFEAAARTGSFTLAARETGLTQASISQRIGQLEARLGTQLFLRGARGVSLTVAGETWQPYVSAALQGLQQSAEEIFASRQRRITLTAGNSIIENWLMPRLGALASPPPFEFVFSTSVLTAGIGQQAGDADVRHGAGVWPGRRAARLFKEVLAPVAAPGLTAGEGRWQDLPRIAVSGPRPGWQEWARQTGDPATPVPHLRVDSQAHGLAAARAGLGVLLGSLPLCRDDLAAGRLVRLGEDALQPASAWWFTAPEGAMTVRQWDELCAVFCEL